MRSGSDEYLKLIEALKGKTSLLRTQLIKHVDLKILIENMEEYKIIQAMWKSLESIWSLSEGKKKEVMDCFIDDLVFYSLIVDFYDALERIGQELLAKLMRDQYDRILDRKVEDPVWIGEL